MIVDLNRVKNFRLGVQVEDMAIMDIIKGSIKYKVGDSWSDKVREGYKTMFAYYYYYNNPQPGKDCILKQKLNDQKEIGINFTKLSFAEIPLSFHRMLGVTGTLETMN
jgi:hypothetical protein